MNNYPKNGQDGNKDTDKKKDKFVRVNWKIRNQYCRVIEEGRQPRIMPTKEAIEYAQDLGLDLIEIGYDKANNCSNCKVYDYGKYQYETKRREKMAKKQARAAVQEVKCLQISLTTDSADLERIVSHAKEFLAAGDKVKLSLRFRNRRESANVDLAKTVMKDVLTKFDGIALLDSPPSLAGRELACILRKA